MRRTPNLFTRLVFGLVVSVSTGPMASGTLYIAFRYDDLASDAPGARERDDIRRAVWEAEKAVDRLFEKHGFAYTIAVIPYRNAVPLSVDPDKVEFLKNGMASGRVEVAQHGFRHINCAAPGHRIGEFLERGYQSQFADLTRGREILLTALGVDHLDVFVPPWNAWTYDTGRILQELGFRILSAGPEHYYDSIENMVLIPRTCNLPGLERLLAEGTLPQTGVIVVLYHPTDIVPHAGYDYIGLERFEKLLKALSGIAHVRVATLSSVAQAHNDLTPQRAELGHKLAVYRSFWAKVLPGRLLVAHDEEAVYPSSAEYLQMLKPWRYLTWAALAGIGGLGLGLRLILRWVFFRKWLRRIDLGASLLCCAALLSEIYLVYHRGFHPTGIRLFPAVFAGSFVVYLMVGILARTKPVDVGSPGAPILPTECPRVPGASRKEWEIRDVANLTERKEERELDHLRQS